MFKKVCNFLLVLLMVFSTLSITSPVDTLKVEASQGEYEIYPVPQKVTYGAGQVALSGEVNVVMESKIDKATENRLKTILEQKGIPYQIGKEKVENKTNILVGTFGSNELVDTYVKNTDIIGTNANEHFSKFDSYILSVKDNVIAVLGKDSDAAFYGLTTLKLIMNQLTGESIKTLQISDFSDGQWRGFIEGYYGIPWSHDNRKSLMEFGGDFKMNAYIFAPKDDVYHSQKWRDPYPTEELAKIKELVETGEATKCNFIWSIHPFLKDGMDFTTDAKYQAELQLIKTKFDQLYTAGVRQFGVLADDAEGDAANQVKLMSDLEAWRVAKGDVKPFIFVPKVYTKESAGGDVNNAYLNTMRNMPATVDIMWTGDVIMGYVTQDTFDFFKQAVGREPFMWLNWPVNDINSSRLLMGKGEMLDPSVTGFKGIVTNPMQEAQASKVSLFAIADYGWNTADFNTEKSWNDSFKYIDKDAAEELHTFAKHMSDPTPNWHGLALSESKEISPLLEQFRNAYFNGESITEISKSVLTEYQEIIAATNDFFTKSKNALMKTEITPWVNALRDISESTVLYIQAAQALDAGDIEKAMLIYTKAEAEYANSRTHRAPTLDGPTGKRAEPAIKELIPFAKDMSRMINEKMKQKLNPEKNALSLLPYTNMGPNLYWGHIQNIVDGGNARLSCIWVRNSAKADDYVAVKLNKTANIQNIVFEQGEPGAGDAFNYVKFQFSMDGQHWTDIDGKAYGPSMQKIVMNNINVKAKYVRAIPTGEILNNWISIREFSVYEGEIPQAAGKLYTNMSSTQDIKITNSENSTLVKDAKHITLKKGEYVGIQFEKIKDITALVSNITNDNTFDIETSVNGDEWVNIKTTATGAARYIRIINNTNKTITFDMKEFGAEFSKNDVIFDVRPAAEAGFAATNVIDGKLNTGFKPQINAPKTGHLNYKISEALDITKITILQDATTISNAAVSIRSENGWKEIGTLDKTVNAFDTSSVKKVYEIKINWDGVAPTLYEVMTSNEKAPISVDKASLQTWITKAESLKSDAYTTTSWAMLQEKLKVAKTVLANADATQEQVNNAKTDLEKAVTGLIKKPETQDPINPPKPSEPEKPEVPSKPNGENGNNQGNNASTTKPSTTPNTGDQTTVVPLAMLGLLSLTVFIKGKRKIKNK